MATHMRLQSLHRPKTLVEQVYERILDAICDGTLGPEEHITQDGLATLLLVSRQPVMTALGQLKQQGFLVERGRRGLRVAPLDEARLGAIHEMRSATEPQAAALAAARATEAEVAAGRAIIERGKRATAGNEWHAVARAETDFHEWLYLASGNPVLAQAMQVHWPHVRRSLAKLRRLQQDGHAAWSENEAVLEAIARGDAAGAAGGVSARLATHRQDRTQQADDPTPATLRANVSRPLPHLAHTVY